MNGVWLYGKYINAMTNRHKYSCFFLLQTYHIPIPVSIDLIFCVCCKCDIKSILYGREPNNTRCYICICPPFCHNCHCDVTICVTLFSVTVRATNLSPLWWFDRIGRRRYKTLVFLRHIFFRIRGPPSSHRQGPHVECNEKTEDFIKANLLEILHNYAKPWHEILY